MDASNSNSVAILLLVVGAVYLCVYFLPAVVAIFRGHPNGFAIGMFNLFLGWSFVGWVIALVWSCTAIPTAIPANATSANPSSGVRLAGIGILGGIGMLLASGVLIAVAFPMFFVSTNRINELHEIADSFRNQANGKVNSIELHLAKLKTERDGAKKTLDESITEIAKLELQLAAAEADRTEREELLRKQLESRRELYGALRENIDLLDSQIAELETAIAQNRAVDSSLTIDRERLQELKDSVRDLENSLKSKTTAMELNKEPDQSAREATSP